MCPTVGEASGVMTGVGRIVLLLGWGWFGAGYEEVEFCGRKKVWFLGNF